jgi:TonB family protein
MAQRMRSLEDERNQLAQQVTSAKTDEERARAKKALEDAQKKIDAQKEEQARLAAASPAPSKPPSPGPASASPTPATSAPQPATAAPAGPSPQPQPSGSSPPPPQSGGGTAPPPTTPAEAAPAESPKVKPGDFVELWAVDLKPQRQGDLKVTVTPAARSNRLSGTIYVEVTIDETGKVVDSKVVRGLNPDYGMNDVCREAASRLKYTPAVKEGVPVKTKMTFPIMIK